MERREALAVSTFAFPLVFDGVSAFLHLCRDFVALKHSADHLETAGGRNSQRMFILPTRLRDYRIELLCKRFDDNAEGMELDAFHDGIGKMLLVNPEQNAWEQFFTIMNKDMNEREQSK